MGMNYSAVLVLGVPLKRHLVVTGTRTRYNPDTGEPYNVDEHDYEWRTKTGVVAPGLDENATDDECDDWYDPEPGQWTRVGREGDTGALGVFVAEIEPKYAEGCALVDPALLDGWAKEARKRLDEMGIDEPVRLVLTPDVG